MESLDQVWPFSKPERVSKVRHQFSHLLEIVRRYCTEFDDTESNFKFIASVHSIRFHRSTSEPHYSFHTIYFCVLNNSGAHHNCCEMTLKSWTPIVWPTLLPLIRVNACAVFPRSMWLPRGAAATGCCTNCFLSNNCKAIYKIAHTWEASDSPCIRCQLLWVDKEKWCALLLNSTPCMEYVLTCKSDSAH